MKHPSLNVKNIIIKDTASYRVRVESWEVINPVGLHNVDFIQESLDKDGKVEFVSTYNFHMTKEEIKKLCEGLMSI